MKDQTGLSSENTVNDLHTSAFDIGLTWIKRSFVCYVASLTGALKTVNWGTLLLGQREVNTESECVLTHKRWAVRSDFMHMLVSTRKSRGYCSDTFRRVGNTKIVCGCRVEGMTSGEAIIILLSQASEFKLNKLIYLTRPGEKSSGRRPSKWNPTGDTSATPERSDSSSRLSVTLPFSKLISRAQQGWWVS